MLLISSNVAVYGHLSEAPNGLADWRLASGGDRTPADPVGQANGLTNRSGWASLALDGLRGWLEPTGHLLIKKIKRCDGSEQGRHRPAGDASRFVEPLTI